MASVYINGIADLNRKIDSIEKVTNTDDILDTAGAFLLNNIRSRFLQQQAPDGSRWSESSAARKRKAKGQGGGTLFDTGTLFHSISLGRAGRNQRSIFTTVPYAEQHNDGLQGNPQREFLGFSSEDEIGVNNLLERRIQRLLDD